MKHLAPLLSLLLFCPALAAQSDSLRAENLASMAVRATHAGQLDLAETSLRQSLQLFENQDNLTRWWIVQFNAALALRELRPFEALGKIEAALAHPFRQPANFSEKERYCRGLLNLAYIYQWQLHNVAASKDFDQTAFDYFDRELGRNSAPIAQYLYRHLANNYSRLGDFERAKILLQQGIQWLAEHHLPTAAEENDLAIAQKSLGQTEQALATVQTALARADKAPLQYQLDLQSTQIGIFLALGKTAQAQAANEKLPAQIRRLEGTDQAYYIPGLLSQHQQTRAVLFFGQNRAPEGFAALAKAQKFSEAEGSRREVAKIRNGRAEQLLKLGKAAEALAENQAALRLLLPDFRPKNDAENPDPAQFFAENTLFEALEGKAAALTQLGQWEAALACFEVIPRVENLLRQNYAYESAELLLSNFSRQRFDRAVELAWLLFEKTGQTQFAERAFQLTEQARGRLLLQSMARAKLDFQLPPEIARRERELDARIAWLEEQVAKDPAQAAALDQRKREREAFQKQLRRDFPAYAQLSDEIHLANLGDVRGLLRPGQLLADFYLTDTSVFLFFFNETGFVHWRKCLVFKMFRQTAQQFALSLIRADETDALRNFFGKTSAELFAQLLGPELGSGQTPATAAQSLIVVPDDVLAFLPFEILLTAAPPAAVSAWPDLPFLLKKMPLSYAYSATLLRDQQALSAKHTAVKGRKSWAGFAPKYENTADTSLQKLLADRSRGGTIDLPGARAEVGQIRKITGGNAFLGPDASESNFKAEAEKYCILHLAMHALADEENPALSRLFFGDESHASEDNILYANELQILRLQADLAVLSACHTGFGRWQRGEGVLSLARAFAAAGVPATVMSLWRLPDRSAPFLMQRFYENLAAGLPKDAALQQAKLAYLQTDTLFNFTHPYFWAGLVANGDMRALPRSGIAWWVWVLGVLAGLFALFAARRIFRKSQPG